MATKNTIVLPNARPYAFSFPTATTVLIIIDMQRDFLEPGGFGSIQCGNPEAFTKVRNIVPKIQKVLQESRAIGLRIFHTREGHKSDLSDLPSSKRLRQVNNPKGHHSLGIEDTGPMGKLLVRGEYGHDVIDELKPFPGEVVIDKPGKGSFWSTCIHRSLLARGITHLLFAGVTTECCVTTTLRECNDRGYQCCILSDCTAGFDQQFVSTSLDIICGYDGLFGFVSHSSDFLTQASSAVTPPSTPPTESDNSLVSISELQHRYKTGFTDPETIIRGVFLRIEEYEKQDAAVWISRASEEEVLTAVQGLRSKYNGKQTPPLFGVPFALKNNIDVEGIPTTAGCETYTYIPTTTAPAVQHLLDAGAVYVGKLNMDELATGLSGCRSPFGNPHSVFSKSHISGGSSSGSGVAVAAGLVSFTLGTDTAGSGHVPAAFNGTLGFKPTKGTVSARGVVPACATLDTLSIMATNVEDARSVWYILDVYDNLDPYAKLPSTLTTWHVDFRGPKIGGFTFGVPPPSILGICSEPYQQRFRRSIERLIACGGKMLEIDYSPFNNSANLLYNASLVYERISCIGQDFLSNNMDALHPTTKRLFQTAFESKVMAWEVFRDQALQARYTREAHQIFETIDVLFLPTTPYHPTIQEMEEQPLTCNAQVGTFTHAADVLDLCGISVNDGFLEGGLPFGVSFLGGSGKDGKLLDIAAIFEENESSGRRLF